MRTTSVTVQGKRIGIKIARSTHRGNHDGYIVYVNGMRYHRTTLYAHEAIRAAVTHYIFVVGEIDLDPARAEVSYSLHQDGSPLAKWGFNREALEREAAERRELFPGSELSIRTWIHADADEDSDGFDIKAEVM